MSDTPFTSRIETQRRPLRTKPAWRNWLITRLTVLFRGCASHLGEVLAGEGHLDKQTAATFLTKLLAKLEQGQSDGRCSKNVRSVAQPVRASHADGWQQSPG